MRCTGNAEIVPMRDVPPLQQELLRIKERFATEKDPLEHEKKVDAEFCTWLGNYFKTVSLSREKHKATNHTLGLLDVEWSLALGRNQEKLNVLEKDLFNKNPVVGIQVLAIANKAKERQDRLFPNINPRSRNGDAFKHAYWNALLARHHGNDVALLWADAHEHPSAPNPLLERKMDFLNNAIGRKIGLALSQASDTELEDVVLGEMKAARLWRVCNNTPNPGSVESSVGVLLPTSGNMFDSLHSPCEQAAQSFGQASIQSKTTNNDCPWYFVNRQVRATRRDNAQIGILFEDASGSKIIGGVGDQAQHNKEIIFMKRLDLSKTRYLVAIYGPSVLRNRLGWMEQTELAPIEKFCQKSADFEAILGRGRPSLMGKNSY